MSLIIPDSSKEDTEAAFDNPKVGDRFQEFYTFWMYVVAVKPKIVVRRGSAPIRFPDGAERVEYDSVEDFKRAYSYGSIPGYWVRLADHNNDVRGWSDS